MIAKGTGYQRGGSAAGGQLMAHVKYLLHRAKGEGEAKRELFDAAGSVPNRQAAVSTLSQHFGNGIAYHKLVLSPSRQERALIDARGPDGWQDWTREVLTELGARVGKDLHWVAVKHANTNNPHVHVIIAGVGQLQAPRPGKAGSRGRHPEVQLRAHDFRAIEQSGHRAAGIRERADVQRQLTLFQEHDRLFVERGDTAHEHDHAREESRGRDH